MPMIAFVLRWVMPAVGLLAVTIGLLDAPRRGEPPLGSMLNRTETVVRRAGVESALAAGRLRHEAVVEVVWPPGSDATDILRGLRRGGATVSLAAAEAVAAAYRPGARVSVRVADGVPWADRTDWFALFWTVSAVLLGALLTLVGLLLNRALRR